MILEPAIDYARQGHPLLPGTVDTIASVRDLLWPSGRAPRRYFLQDGAVPAAGSLFANPTLGDLYATVLARAEAAWSDRAVQIETALGYWYEGPVPPPSTGSAAPSRRSMCPDGLIAA